MWSKDQESPHWWEAAIVQVQVQSHPGYGFRDMALGSWIWLTVGQLEKLLMQPGLIPSDVDSFGPVWELNVVIYF